MKNAVFIGAEYLERGDWSKGTNKMGGWWIPVAGDMTRRSGVFATLTAAKVNRDCDGGF